MLTTAVAAIYFSGSVVLQASAAHLRGVYSQAQRLCRASIQWRGMNSGRIFGFGWRQELKGGVFFMLLNESQ